MTFGNGAANIKRRKTSHINDNFRKFLRAEVSRVLGIKVSARQAMTMFKVLMKAPLRFLVTLDEKDYDQHGDRAIAVTGVGNFKIIKTAAQGRRQELVKEGEPYPRYKYYPSTIVEHEVEILNNLESSEGRTVYNRTLSSEKYNVDLCNREILRLLENKNPSIIIPNYEVAKSLSNIIQDMINYTLTHNLSNFIDNEEDSTEEPEGGKNLGQVFQDMIDATLTQNLPNFIEEDTTEDDEDDDDGDEYEEEEDITEEFEEEEDTTEEDTTEEVEEVEEDTTEEVEEVEEDTLTDSTDVTSVANALDSLDFDFN